MRRSKWWGVSGMLILAILVFGAMAWGANTVSSATMVFEGTLTANGDGSYTGTIAMVDEAVGSTGDATTGYNVYARNGAKSTYDKAPSGQDYACGRVTAHDAYTTAGGWGTTYDPDVADWYNYQLRLESGNWYLEYNGNVGNDGILTGAVGDPMSGTVDWSNMYAAETGAGAYYTGMGTAESPGYALDNTCTGVNTGLAAWDMDWSWGSEYIPLAFPGFDVVVTDLGSGNYRITLTPADGRDYGVDVPGPVVNETTGESYGTIQAAIDEATNGDTIDVAPGTYDEPVNIEGFHGLTINGVDKSTVIVKPSSTLCWSVASYGCSRWAVFRVVDSTDVVLQNMTMDFDLVKANGVTGVLYWNSTGTVTNNILKNMSVSDSSGGYYEIGSYYRAPGYTDTARANITISNNTFIDTGRLGVCTHQYVNATITGNTFCKTTDDFGNAIEMGSESTGTISDNTIYGYNTPAASDGSVSIGIYIENGHTSSTSGVTKNVSVTGNEVYDSQWALYVGNIFDGSAGDVDIVANVSNNNFHDNVDGAVVITDEDKANGSSVSVSSSGNTLTNNGDYGYNINTQGDGDVTVAISGETITGHDTGVYVVEDTGSSSSSSYSVTIDESNISGNTTYGVNNTVTSFAVDATNNWWGSATGPYQATTNPSGLGDAVSDYVDYSPYYTDAAMTSSLPVHNVTKNLYYSTIQAAIDGASANDVIEVAAGTYAEQLTIDKAVTLNGANAGINAVTGTRGDESVIDVSGFTVNGISVTEDSVTIDGFEIIGIPYGSSTSSNVNPTIAAEASYVTVQNCIFNTSGSALGKEAMVARPGTNHISFLNNEVNNYIYGITARGNNYGGSATLPADGVRDLTVSGNTFNVAYVDTSSQITGEAVQIHYGNNIVVTGNTINGPGTFDTSTYDTYDPINSIGIVDFMSGYGAAGTITYSNNEVTNCYVGIATFAGNGQISGNTVTGNNTGIQVGQNDAVYITTSATGVAITGNDITNNKVGIDVQNFVVDGLAAHYNNISGNTDYGVQNSDTDEFDAANNWWGSANGPTHVGNTFNVGSQGNAVSDNVDYLPWYNTDKTGTSFAPVTTDELPVGEYSSIQAAIDGVTGTTITCAAGTFTEDLVIDVPNLVLQGVGATTIIQGVQRTLSTAWPLCEPNIDIQVDGVKVHDLTFKSPVWADGYYSSGMAVKGKNVEVYNITFQGPTSDDTDDISQCFQTWNTFDVSGLDVHNNTFTSSGTGAYGYEGVYINSGGSGLVQIRLNTFGGSLLRAITTVRGNTTISGNTITTSLDPAYAFQGIWVSAANVTVTNNEVKGTSGFGKGIDIGATGFDLHDITLTGNTVGPGNDIGIRVRGDLTGTGVEIHSGKITGNVTSGMDASTVTGGSIDATRNWWGSYGPSGEGPGTGDAVSTNVDFDPWYTNEAMTTQATMASNSYADAGWNLVSVPLQPMGPGDGDSVFEEAGQLQFRMLRYNPGTTGYDTGGGLTVKPEYGFWLYLSAPSVIDMGGTDVTDGLSTGDYWVSTADFANGWQQIGAPFKTNWDDTLVSNNDGANWVSMDQAMTNGWLDPNIFAWNSATQKYEYVAYVIGTGSSVTLHAWDGCWVENKSGGNLRFKFYYDSAVQPASFLPKAMYPSTPWRPMSDLKPGAARPPAPPMIPQAAAISQDVDVMVAPNPVQQGKAVEFRVTGTMAMFVSSVSVQVYTVGGQLVFDDSSMGQSLTWNLTTLSGEPVANGLYLYVAKMEFNGGQTAKFNKLLILK